MRTSAHNKRAKLAKEIRKFKAAPFRVAAVFFGEPRELWKEKFDSRNDLYKSLFGEDSQIRLVAPESFLNDVAWADVIYLHGGYADKIAQYLDKISDLKKLFSDKIVIGDSAGAVYLARDAWEAWTDERLTHGRGLVSIAVIPHFESKIYNTDDAIVDWESAKREMSSETDLPICPIHEGDFEIFEEDE